MKTETIIFSKNLDIMPTYNGTLNGYIRDREAIVNFVYRIKADDPQLEPSDTNELESHLRTITAYLGDFELVRIECTGDDDDTRVSFCDDSISELKDLRGQLEYIKAKDAEMFRERIEKAKKAISDARK